MSPSPSLSLPSFFAAAMLGLSTVLPRDPFNLVLLAVGVLSVFVLATFAVGFGFGSKEGKGKVRAYLKFAYACFLKPHTGDGNGDQQDALVGWCVAEEGCAEDDCAAEDCG